MAQTRRVTLNKTEVRTLSKINDSKSRAQTKADILREKQAKADLSAEKFRQVQAARKARELEASVSESGDALILKNSGTKFGFMLLDVKHAKQLKAQWKSISTMIDSLVENSVTADEIDDVEQD